MRHLTSITQLSKQTIIGIVKQAMSSKARPQKYRNALKDKIIATLFFEPSTRTRLSFESAALRLGARVLGFADANTTSTKKGETLEDTIRIVNGFADIIVLRHQQDGASDRAARVSTIPIINGGDGSNEHPTQALLDIFTIAEKKSKRNAQNPKPLLKTKNLENLKIAFVGDLKYGRTVHSLSQGLAHFNPTYYFISPAFLKMPGEILQKLREKKIPYEECEKWETIAKNVDILYLTRVQEERFTNKKEYQRLKSRYVLNKKTAALFNKNCLFMHPLPRITEINPEIDDDPRSIYFHEAHNGVWMRMALFLWIMKIQ